MRLSSHTRPFVQSGLAVLAIILTGFSSPALAAHHRHHTAVASVARKVSYSRRMLVRMLASPTDPEKDAELIVDGATGKVLYARNEKVERHPASLTKMMTLYLLFEALKRGQLTLETPLPVSYHASVQKPTKLNLRPGQTISVDTAIRAIVIRSANDVAVVIAEALGGTESHFAEMMTAKARQLGMMDTNYHNASGLPDPLQITTASDLALLARHLAYDFPQYFPYFGLRGFTYKGSYYPTHDNLIGRYPGADGIKTGYIGASGFNLVSSVTRGTTHIIGVVMGGRTAMRRDLEMVRLLDQTFAQINANPNLVARVTVPWQQMAENTPAPAIAGFSFPQVTTSAQSNEDATLSGVPKTLQLEDEDAAESTRAPDENVAIIHGETPSPAPAVPAVPPSANFAQAASQDNKDQTAPVHPSPRPDLFAAVQVALDNAQQKDQSADDPPSPSARRNWAIQIGVYTNRALADAQLKTYERRAHDVLAHALRIIAPLQHAHGRTIYRARFGLFAEAEARNVCNLLTQRGQTCIATLQRR